MAMVSWLKCYYGHVPNLGLAALLRQASSFLLTICRMLTGLLIGALKDNAASGPECAMAPSWNATLLLTLPPYCLHESVVT